MADSDFTYDPLDVARFWSNVSVAGVNECWPWKRYCKSGYGQVKWLGRAEEAHRIAYTIAYGDVPRDVVVRHRCDNPKCCNPQHLQTGTHADNVMDRVLRGRSARGERNGLAKLKEEQVRAIAGDERPATAIAPEYGVSVDTVRSIKQRRIWRHLW